VTCESSSRLMRWAALVGAWMFVSAVHAQAATTRLRPLDPLTPAERNDAERIARADGRVRDLLGSGRSRLIYVEFLSVKSESGAPPTVRHAEVVFYRYDEDTGVRAVVNLTTKAVTDAGRLDSGVVPLSLDEHREALTVAVRNPDVQQILGADEGCDFKFLMPR